MNRFFYPLCMAALASGLSTTATAQTVLSGDYSVDGELCVGGDCTGSETFGNGLIGQIKIKGQEPGLVLEDTGGTSTNDWKIQGNATNEDSISIGDVTSGTFPFKVMGAAPDNSLLVAADGKIGLGTMLPTANLHLKNGPLSEIRFEAANSSDFNYLLQANEFGFYFFTQSPGIVQQNTPRVIIHKNAPPFAFAVDPSEVRIGPGNSTYDFRINGVDGSDPSARYPPLFFTDSSTNRVGIGTETPDAPLQLSSRDTFNFFRITANGAAVNESVDITFTGGPLGTGQLRYNILDGDNQEMSLDANGNMVLDGTLTTAGPTCAAGCDRVFAEDYALKSIADHQAQMWTNGYLPNVGPTPEDGPFNVSDKMGRMLNELEHAHIYIGELHDRLEAQESEKAALQDTVAQQEARLAALEALILQ